MDKEEVVTSYKKLEQVEKAFRNLKTVQLEMRPVYHNLDHRIKAHVFLCMLGRVDTKSAKSKILLEGILA